MWQLGMGLNILISELFNTENDKSLAKLKFGELSKCGELY